MLQETQLLMELHHLQLHLAKLLVELHQLLVLM